MPSRANVRSEANKSKKESGKKQRTQTSFWINQKTKKPKYNQVAPSISGTAKGVKRRRRKSTKKIKPRKNKSVKKRRRKSRRRS